MTDDNTNETPGVEPTVPLPYTKVPIAMAKGTRDGDTKEHPKCEFAFVEMVMGVNHKPHPFTIGPRHVEHASDRCGGRLGEESLNAFPCAASGCGMDYADHTCDRVAFVKLSRDTRSEELGDFLRTIVDDCKAWIADNRVDGFTFIDDKIHQLLPPTVQNIVSE